MKKLFTSIFLVLALLAMTAGSVFAQEATTITGTVQSIVIQTNDTTGETVVTVTLIDESGASQTVDIKLETAVTLGLVMTDPITGESTVVEGVVGSAVEIDPTTILPTEAIEDTEKNQHPVGTALSNFFSELLGVDYETIMTYHDSGVGFGVIAQALWLTNDLEGDTVTFEALITAKQTHDFSTITLADGSTPDNWGDVVKSLKKGGNLGSVMSGSANENMSTPSGDTVNAPDNGHVNGNNGNSGGHGNGNNGNNGNRGGNNNGGGNGHGNGGSGRP